MITHQSVRDWADAYRRAWEAADGEAVARLFTSEATYRSEIYAEPHVGRSGVTDYWVAVTSSQTEIEVTMGSPVVDGDKATVEFWTNMKVEGDDMTLAGCLLLDFEGDLCSALREYWNFTPGSHRPPAGWGD